jgi:lia operon protein LiaI
MLRLNGKSGLALILIALGALILLDFIGFGLGNILGFLVPAAMVALGYIGIKRGRSFIGWVLVIIGLISLLGKMSGFFGLIIAGAFIYFGYTMLKRSSSTV